MSVAYLVLQSSCVSFLCMMAHEGAIYLCCTRLPLSGRTSTKPYSFIFDFRPPTHIHQSYSYARNAVRAFVRSITQLVCFVALFDGMFTCRDMNFR